MNNKRHLSENIVICKYNLPPSYLLEHLSQHSHLQWLSQPQHLSLLPKPVISINYNNDIPINIMPILIYLIIIILIVTLLLCRLYLKKFIHKKINILDYLY